MRFGILSVLSLVGLFAVASCQTSGGDWRNADRSSAGLTRPAGERPEAVVQIYAARAFRWRGAFAVHCWVAVKEEGASEFEVLQVMGWRLGWSDSVISSVKDVPDRRWYGAEPELLFELSGPEASRAIPKIREAVATYPYPREYRAWPGPNSNTFVSHIVRSVPELTVELPPHAIGKDWLPNGIADWSESGTGVQFSLFGLLGLTVGAAEGLELNVLGLTVGIDVLNPALKLPFVGRVGFPDGPVGGGAAREEQTQACASRTPASLWG